MNVIRFLATATLLLAASTSHGAPYYLFDGDSNVAYELSTSTGTLTNTFNTFSLGYPAAIRTSIWLGGRDDTGATEYSLGRLATGNTSAGGGNFSQLLDGATGTNGKNYGVECCSATNSVTVANADWSGQAFLFNLSGDGAGIAFDPSDNTLFVTDFSGIITHYNLVGGVLGTFNLGQVLIGLAFDQSTDTFWGFNRNTDNLVQFSRAGAMLSDLDIPGFNPSNPFGGEMAVTMAITNQVPEPASLALTLAALGGLVITRRRKSQARA